MKQCSIVPTAYANDVFPRAASPFRISEAGGPLRTRREISNLALIFRKWRDRNSAKGAGLRTASRRPAPDFSHARTLPLMSGETKRTNARLHADAANDP